MGHSWLASSRWWILAPLLALLVLAAACGDDATPEPAPTSPPAPAGATAAEVAAAVQAAVAGIQPSAPGVSPEEMMSMVEQAVAAQAQPGATAAEIDALVKAATEAAAEGAVSSEELRAAIDQAVSDAVMQAVAAIPTPLPTFTPVPIATPAAAMITAPWFKEGRRGGVVPMSNTSDQGFTDPHAEPGTAGLTSKLMAQVLRYDHVDTGVIIGDLAKSWDVSSDGTSYTFAFHDAKWPDGRPITAEDVKFSMDRMVEEGSPRPRAGNLRPYYAGSEVLDAETLKVDTTIAYAPGFLQYLAINYMKILPKHILEPMGTDEARQRFLNNPDNLNAVVSGPFTVQAYLQDNFWEYERNPGYFKEGLPFLDGIRVFIINNLTKLTTAFRTEQVLMNHDADMGLTLRDLVAFQKDMQGKVTVHFLGATAFDGFTLNHTKPPLDDPNVRRAVYLALDRLDFINTNHQGQAKMGTPFPPGSWMTPPDEVVATWPGFRYVDKDGNPLQNYYDVPDAVKDPRDLEEANRLLDEAGFDRSQTFVWLMGNAPLHKNMGTLAKQQLEKNIGLQIELELQDFPTIFERAISGNYDFFFLWHGINISDSDEMFNQLYATPGGSKNRLNWEHPRIQELFHLSAREPDPTERQKLIWEAGDILRQGEDHWFGIDWRQNYVAVNNKIQNFFPAQTYQQGNHHEAIWLAQ
jgi:peptide/nickel transport system substrate-binding protein